MVFIFFKLCGDFYREQHGSPTVTNILTERVAATKCCFTKRLRSVPPPAGSTLETGPQSEEEPSLK